jgi:hypothetical protein
MRCKWLFVDWPPLTCGGPISESTIKGDRMALDDSLTAAATGADCNLRSEVAVYT